MPRKKPRKASTPAVDPMKQAAAAYAHLDAGGSADAGRERLAQLQDTLGRKFGKSTALTLSVAPHARVRRLPFGILMLDWKTNGGLVIGRVNRIWGRKSTLKSTLCLRALRSAQNHCRHCKAQMVRHPDCRCREAARYKKTLDRLAEVEAAQGPIPVPGTELAVEWSYLTARKRRMEEQFGVEALAGCAHAARIEAGEEVPPCVDCECPKPRWWLADEKDYAWLPAAAAIELYYGRLPTGAVWKKVTGYPVDKLPVIQCTPPPAALRNADGSPKKKPPKPRDVVLQPMRRCEPMRCLYVDGEGTIDNAWAEANGVDLDLVVVIGTTWGEAVLETVEEATLSQDFDFVVIDSTSVLEPQKELEKGMEDSPKVAAKAAMVGRWVTRQLVAMFDQGMTSRYTPTILCTSQVTMKGLGGGIRPYAGPTDGNRFEHALSLDIKMEERGYTFDKNNEHAIRGRFDFTVKKNKAGGSVGATGTINFYVRAVPGHPVGDSDDLATVMERAREMGAGFIESGTGSRLLTLKCRYLPGGEVSFSRVGDCEAFLRANPTVYDDLRTRVLRQLQANDVALVVAPPAGATA